MKTNLFLTFFYKDNVKEVYGKMSKVRKVDNYDYKEIEQAVQEYWEINNIPQKLTTFRRGLKKYYLLDGPPYINAEPHVGHVKTTVCKDVWTKYKFMRGFDAHLQAGFDCHGLPIEVIVQKELGITNKKDIEKMGIEKFEQKCLEKILNNEKKWIEYYKKIGAWRGYYEPYFTYKKSYIESAWWTLKTMHEKGILNEGENPNYWCPTCETVLSGYEVSDSYKNILDPSIYIKFRIKGKQNEYLLVWTTTPWTLPANVAIIVAPKEDYVRVRVIQGDLTEYYIIAEKRLEEVLKKQANMDYEIQEKIKGSDLDGLEYEPIIKCNIQDKTKNIRRVRLSIPVLASKQYKKHATESNESFTDFVNVADGTGLVHCAPGHGLTDYYMGIHYNLPALSPVNEEGKFNEDVEQFQGRQVKEADKDIISLLESEGKVLLFNKETHPYPLCWRCKTPLIFRMTKQWYLNIDTIKDKMIRYSENADWNPAFGREAMRNWIQDAGDWCISRQRYWATPIPIWKCGKCSQITVIGSFEELIKKTIEPVGDLQDLHRHNIDELTINCEQCGGQSKRIKDVFDVWFDSGIAAWASLGYPFENKELFEKMQTLDMICESQDQIRGWYYHLIFTYAALFDKPAFKSASLMGWVVDEKGLKMSKSVGNVISASDAIEKIGSDALRLYYCSEIAPYDVQKFSIKAATDAHKTLLILWNSVNFCKTYRKTKKQLNTDEVLELITGTKNTDDDWIISRLQTTILEVDKAVEKFEFHIAGRTISNFIVNDVSRTYIKLIRDTIQEDENVSLILNYVLTESLKLLAPFTPFTTEYLYQELLEEESEEPKSIHTIFYPEVNAKLKKEKLEKTYENSLKIVEAMNNLRQKFKLRNRWPLEYVKINSKEEYDEELIKKLANVDEVVKESKFTEAAMKTDEFTIEIPEKLSKTQLEKAFFREVVRAIQAQRKKAGYNVNQKIQVYSSKNKILEEMKDELSKEVNAEEITFVTSKKGSNQVTVELEDLNAEIGFE
ncbi:Isoleucine--tRNA ligase [uncultured archaeon]|nr:Isoleucine--tRNA ligase [uncultured archaeon]